MSIPTVTVLCGSTRFCQVMAVCAWLLERDEGHITMGLHLLPDWYWAGEPVSDHLAESEGVADAQDALHLRKIDLCDEVFIVDVGRYIGNSTANEIRYATALHRPIRRYTDDPIGLRVGELLGIEGNRHFEDLARKGSYD